MAQATIPVRRFFSLRNPFTKSSLRSLLATSLLLFIGLAGTYTVDSKTYPKCAVQASIGIPGDYSPKVAITSCGAFILGPHTKPGLTNMENIATMNRVVNENDVIRVKTTGWPIPVAYSISKEK